MRIIKGAGMVRINSLIKVAIVVLLLGGILAAGAAGKQGRPNVLFIAIDDMNDWTTLFDKKNPIRTPTWSGLRREGCFSREVIVRLQPVIRHGRLF